MKRIYLAAAAATLFALPAFGASTINPAVPAQNSPMASAPIRNNFAAAYNDVNNILTDFAGTSAPLSPSTNQSWMDTTVASAWKLKIYDGTTWVQLGTLNPTAHTFTYTASTVPLPTPSTLGGSFSKSAVSHFFLTGLGTDGIYTVAQPACADVSNAGTVCTKNTGKSVADPGTGALESMLPIQTVTGTSKTYATADLQLETRRSNSGTPMTDTFPSSATTGMANGTRITVANVDVTAIDTITAGAGTSFTSGATDVVEAGRAVTYSYDSGSSIWRKAFNTSTGAILASIGTNTPGNVVSMASAYGKVQDSGIAAANLAHGPGTSTTNNLAAFAGTDGTTLKDSGTAISLLVTGPGSSTNAHLAQFNGTSGSVLADSGVAAGPYASAAQGQLPGTTNGTAATSGNIGQNLGNTVGIGSAVSLVSGIPKTIVTQNFSAGCWLIRATVATNPAGSTTTAYILGAISTTTNTLPTFSDGNFMQNNIALGAGLAQVLPVGSWYQCFSSSQNVFLVAQVSFAVSTMSAFGSLYGIRLN